MCQQMILTYQRVVAMFLLSTFPRLCCRLFAVAFSLLLERGFPMQPCCLHAPVPATLGPSSSSLLMLCCFYFTTFVFFGFLFYVSSLCSLQLLPDRCLGRVHQDYIHTFNHLYWQLEVLAFVQIINRLTLFI